MSVGYYGDERDYFFANQTIKKQSKRSEIVDLGTNLTKSLCRVQKN